MLSLAVAWWVLGRLVELWRAWIWRQHGAVIEAVAVAGGAALRPRGFGWRVEAAHGWVEWRGGPFGVQTVWRLASGAGQAPALLDAESLARLGWPAAKAS